MKSLRISILAIAFLAVLFSFTSAFAQTPIPLNVPLPTQGGGTPPPTVTGIGQYLERLYFFSWTIGAFLAMLMIVVGAVQYTVSGGNPSGQKDAKDRILNAIYGLILLLAVALILRTLNPKVYLGGSGGGFGGGSSGGGAGGSWSNPPSNLSLNYLPNQNGMLRLTWTDNSDENHFRVEYGGTTNGPWTSLYDNVGQNNTQWDFFKPTNGDFYRVVAVEGNGDTIPSAAVQIPQTPVSNALASPEIFSIIRPSNNTGVQVSWRDYASNETGYRIDGLLSTAPQPQGLSVLPGGPPTAPQGNWQFITNSGPVSQTQGQPYGTGSAFFNSVPANGQGFYTHVRVVAEGNNNGSPVYAFSDPAGIPPLGGGAFLPAPNAAPYLSTYTWIQNPISLTGQPTYSGIFLAWNDNSENEAGFLIQAKPAASQTWTTVAQAGVNEDSKTVSFSSSPLFQPGANVMLRIVAVASTNANNRASNEIPITIP